MSNSLTLDRCAVGQTLKVVGVDANDAPADWAVWLEEIGFTEGEECKVMQRAMPGGEPLAVRIGASTFALRAAEARCIRVRATDK